MSKTLQNYRLNRSQFSDCFWTSIFDNGVWLQKEIENYHTHNYSLVEKRRAVADFNTGSISFATTVALSQAIVYFKPRVIAEVGTFIGRSTMAMAHAGFISNVFDLNIHTCDLSNAIDIDVSNFCKLTQYKKTSSASMLQSLDREDIQVDAFVIDGRLDDESVDLIKAVSSKRWVIFLDDFEGNEKGVVNADSLLGKLDSNPVLVYPPPPELLRRYSIVGRSSLAAIIPVNLIELTNQ